MRMKIHLRKSNKILHNNTVFIAESVYMKLEVHKFPVLFNAVAKNWDFNLILFMAIFAKQKIYMYIVIYVNCAPWNPINSQWLP